MNPTSYARSIREVSSENPYLSPTQTSPEKNSPIWLGRLARCGIYVLTGMALYAAFCSPLNPVYVNLFTHELWIGRTLLPAALLVAASLVSGLLLEAIFRVPRHAIWHGLAYTVLNALLFATGLAVVEATKFKGFWEKLPFLPFWSLIAGLFGCLFTLHLAGPLSILAIYLAGKTVDADDAEESNG